MNDMTPIPSPTVERQAAALLEIKQMHDELASAKSMINQLKADLNRETDRCIMMVEERNKYRADADLLRNHLMKVCTTVSNIGLLTKEAEAVVLTVNERAADSTLTLEALGIGKYPDASEE